jgi:HAMP domain-containing protein
MSISRAIGRRLVLASLLVLALSLTVHSDELADFHAAVEQATAEYRVAMTTLETRSQEETAAAVQRFRQSWQAINERFTKNRPAPFADDEKFPTMFMLVDTQAVGVLLVIEMGNRDAARAGLAPIGETLATLSARSAPIP